MNKNAINKVIGQRLREMRISASLSQDEVADSCGIAQSEVSRIESGGRIFVDTARKYLNAVGRSWYDLQELVFK